MQEAIGNMARGCDSWAAARRRSAEPIDHCPMGFKRIRATKTEGRGLACRQCTLTHPGLYDKCLELSHDDWLGWKGVGRRSKGPIGR